MRVHQHTHTHTLSLSLPPQPLSPPLSLSLTHTHTHTRTGCSNLSYELVLTLLLRAKHLGGAEAIIDTMEGLNMSVSMQAKVVLVRLKSAQANLPKGSALSLPPPPPPSLRALSPFLSLSLSLLIARACARVGSVTNPHPITSALLCLSQHTCTHTHALSLFLSLFTSPKY